MRNAVKVGDRVYLRPIEVADAGAIANSSHTETEPEFQDDGRVPTSVIAFEAWIRRHGTTGVPDNIVLAICLRDNDRCVGTVRLGDIDWINRTAETGTGLFHAGDRGQGVGTEAKHLLLAYAFHDLRLHALHSMVYAGNTRSAAALIKQGYRPAGRITADVQRDGTFRDTLLYDITREEWEAAYARWRSGRTPTA